MVMMQNYRFAVVFKSSALPQADVIIFLFSCMKTLKASRAAALSLLTCRSVESLFKEPKPAEEGQMVQSAASSELGMHVACPHSDPFVV